MGLERFAGVELQDRLAASGKRGGLKLQAPGYGAASPRLGAFHRLEFAAQRGKVELHNCRIEQEAALFG
jgi:hypothetical protein